MANPRHRPRRLSLEAKAIPPKRYLESTLPEDGFRCFALLSEGGCEPLHVRSRRVRRPVVAVAAHTKAQCISPPDFCPHLRQSMCRVLPAQLPLPEQVLEKARDVVARENAKLGDKGPWIDGHKLAVRSIMLEGGHVSLKVSKLRWSQILAMKDYSFEDLAALRAFKLDTNTHVIAQEGRHKILLVGHRGRKPGEPRMGSEAMLAPAAHDTQWTLATNGTLDAKVLAESSPPEAWRINSMKEFKEELGVNDSYSLDYLGLMADTHMFTGAIGIVGAIDTDLTPNQIDDARKRARDGVEVSALDTIALERKALVRYLRVNRDKMVPQLVTGIVLLGFNRWGMDFLRLADS